MKIRAFKHGDEEAVVQLWQKCGLTVPQNDPIADIKCKETVQPELFLVGVLDGSIIASVMAGYDGHRGWLNYLSVSPERRRNGFGGQMVLEAMRRLRALGCPKINIQVRTSNKEAVTFYQKLGFVEDRVISLGKSLKDT